MQVEEQPKKGFLSRGLFYKEHTFFLKVYGLGTESKY